MPYKISAENADKLLRELARAFRMQNRKHADVEMVIVGGGSILLNYGFREMTDDFDIISNADAAIKEASLVVRDKYDLEYNWVNSDFTQTQSNSALLQQYSALYKVFNNGHFVVRTIKAEYLIAMKTIAYREYKTDRSDIIGVLQAEKEKGHMITFEDIADAFGKLYGEGKKMPPDAEKDIRAWSAMSSAELAELYSDIRNNEESISVKLKEKTAEYPDKVTEANIKDIIEKIRKSL